MLILFIRVESSSYHHRIGCELSYFMSIFIGNIAITNVTAIVCILALQALL